MREKTAISDSKSSGKTSSDKCRIELIEKCILTSIAACFALCAAFFYIRETVPKIREVLLFTIIISTGTTLFFLFSCDKARARTAGLIFWMYLLTVGYVVPGLTRISIVVVPILIYEISKLSTWPVSLLTDFSMGFLTPLLLSNAKELIHIQIESQNIQFVVPFLVITYCFYTPIVILTALCCLKQNQCHIVHDKLRARTIQSRQLMAVNSEISSKMYMIKLDSTQEERMRITKEIHDTAGYVFINVIMLLQAASALLEKDLDKGREKVDFALDYVRKGMNEIRLILHEMKAYEKPSSGLLNEIYDTIQLYMRATGIHVHIEFGNWPRSFNPETDEFFLSFVKEALTNAIKHGNSTSVEIMCWLEHNDMASMIVRDNGGAKKNDEIVLGIGIGGVIDYAESKGGHVEYGFTGSGFSIRVAIPVITNVTIKM